MSQEHEQISPTNKRSQISVKAFSLAFASGATDITAQVTGIVGVPFYCAGKAFNSTTVGKLSEKIADRVEATAEKLEDISFAAGRKANELDGYTPVDNSNAATLQVKNIGSPLGAIAAFGAATAFVGGAVAGVVSHDDIEVNSTSKTTFSLVGDCENAKPEVLQTQSGEYQMSLPNGCKLVAPFR
jgi:hypothetical protein